MLRCVGYVHIPNPPILVDEEPIPPEEINDGRWVYRFHPYWFWEPRPGAPVLSFLSERINDAGYRGPLRAERHKGFSRIAALGDSSTFGYKLPYRSSYPAVLETLSHKTEVLNFGVIGFTAFQGEQLLRRRVLSYYPDQVIVAFGAINEYWPAIGYDVDEKYKITSKTPLIIWKLRDEFSRLRLFQLMDDVLVSDVGSEQLDSFRRNQQRWLGGRGDYLRNQNLNSFKRSLISMIMATKKNGIRIYFVIPPKRSAVEQKWPFASDYTLAIKKISGRCNVPFIDVEKFFRSIPGSDSRLYLDDFHPNAQGHSLYAKYLHDALSSD